MPLTDRPLKDNITYVTAVEIGH